MHTQTRTVTDSQSVRQPGSQSARHRGTCTPIQTHRDTHIHTHRYRHTSTHTARDVCKGEMIVKMRFGQNLVVRVALMARGAVAYSSG